MYWYTMYSVFSFFFFSSRRRHTRCALVTGVQTCALPICLEAVQIEAEIPRKREQYGNGERPAVAFELAEIAHRNVEPAREHGLGELLPVANVLQYRTGENLVALRHSLSVCNFAKTGKLPSAALHIIARLQIGRAHV